MPCTGCERKCEHAAAFGGIVGTWHHSGCSLEGRDVIRVHQKVGRGTWVSTPLWLALLVWLLAGVAIIALVVVVAAALLAGALVSLIALAARAAGRRRLQ